MKVHSTKVWLDLVSVFPIFLSMFLVRMHHIFKQANTYRIKNSFGDFKCGNTFVGNRLLRSNHLNIDVFFSLYRFLFYLCIYICTAGLSLPKCRFSVIKQSRVVCQRSLVAICTLLLHRSGDNLFWNLSFLRVQIHSRHFLCVSLSLTFGFFLFFFFEWDFLFQR